VKRGLKEFKKTHRLMEMEMDMGIYNCGAAATCSFGAVEIYSASYPKVHGLPSRETVFGRFVAIERLMVSRLHIAQKYTGRRLKVSTQKFES